MKTAYRFKTVLMGLLVVSWCILSLEGASPSFFLDARSNLSTGAGNTFSSLPQEITYFEDWSSIGQPANPRRNSIARQRIPGRLELRASSYWVGASGSIITSISKGRFSADVRFDDRDSPVGTGMIPVSLNVLIETIPNTRTSLSSSK